MSRIAIYRLLRVGGGTARGQKEFREALLDAYAGRCAITQCDATAVLEAAHITPYAGEHTHRRVNALRVPLRAPPIHFEN
jgi:hypothetical protein